MQVYTLFNILGAIENVLCLLYVTKSGNNEAVLQDDLFYTTSVDAEFKRMPFNGASKVSPKQWSGLVQEIFADTSILGISFPRNLKAKMKATLLECYGFENME